MKNHIWVQHFDNNKNSAAKHGLSLSSRTLELIVHFLLLCLTLINTMSEVFKYLFVSFVTKVRSLQYREPFT